MDHQLHPVFVARPIRSIFAAIDMRRTVPVFALITLFMVVRGDPIGIGLSLGVVGTTWFAYRQSTQVRLETDGEHARLCSWPQRKVVATCGKGQVVRVRVRQEIRPEPLEMQLWLGPDGKVLGKFAERQWDLAQLDRVRRQMQLPIRDDGELSMRAYATSYPRSVPKPFARPELLFLGMIAMVAVVMTVLTDLGAHL